MNNKPVTKFEERAIPLAKRGLNVFPITEGQKAPPRVSFKEQATTDLDVIRKWAKQWPNDNAGIHCKDLIVVDIDVKNGKDGIKTLELLKNDSILELPDTYCVKTPSGGLHAYFKHAGGVGNSASSIGEGLDIRSNGGYVLASGSVIDGKAYSVIDADIVDTEIVSAESDLIKICSQVKKKSSDQESIELDSVSDSDKEFNYRRAEEYLTRRASAVEGQGGDEHTYVTACKVKDLGVSQDEALELLQVWNEKCEPPWTINELQEKINSAYKYGNEPQGSRLSENKFQRLQDKPAESEIVSEKSKSPRIELNGFEKVNFLSFGNLDRDVILNPKYLVKGLINESTKNVIYGKWNTAKTFLALNMGLSVAMGESWLGFRTQQAGVMLWEYEGAGALNKRMLVIEDYFNSQKTNQGKSIKDYPFVTAPAHLPLVDNHTSNQNEIKGRVVLFDALERFKVMYGEYPKILGLDPYAAVIGGDPNCPTLAANYLSMCDYLIKKYGIATTLIDHSTKNDESVRRGTSLIEGAMDCMLQSKLAESTYEGGSKRGELIVRKARDDAKTTAAYTLMPRKLEIDRDGDMQSSCIILSRDSKSEPMASRTVKVKHLDDRVMDVIISTADDNTKVGRIAVLEACRARDKDLLSWDNDSEQLKRVLARLAGSGKGNDRRIEFDETTITIVKVDNYKASDIEGDIL